ncbi:endoribonuclease L-PSP [Kribbella steppae]|uniref:Endoribonuclease L-PSP n=1 Tax=Kribbella steppae TaxID=2512223 RepID=A0A4R2HI48_9ACTN|nr:Rid family hydrolase [Kribbella steppae]TCO28476.1 endoribonuclease L-PSP [Kribbella steppae]
MVRHFNPAGVWAPDGRAFNQGVIQPEGRVIHVTGQVAWDPNSVVVGVGDAATQLRKSFENVQAILAEVVIPELLVEVLPIAVVPPNRFHDSTP